MLRIPTLTLEGSPTERGRRHGRELASEIRRNLAVYLEQFEYRGVDVGVARENAAQFVDALDSTNPDYVTEMRGVAEGSGVDVVDVALLNMRYEVMYGAYRDEAESQFSEFPEPDGCTSFGVRGSRTESGDTYLGENWDWKPEIETFLYTLRRSDAPDVVAISEAGIVGGKIGLNEHGIGLAINGLVSPADGENPFRKPFHVRCREILDATRFDEALAPVLATNRACSANFLVGHEAGEFVNLETSPERVNYGYPADGIVTHGNHFEDQTHVESMNERLSPSTLYRGPRLRRLLDEDDLVTRDRIESALADHFGHPMSICRHPDPGQEPIERSRTNLSVVMNLSKRTMRVAAGPPCEHEFVETGLDLP